MDQQPAPPATWLSQRLLGWLCVGVLTAVAVASALYSVVFVPPLVHPTLLPRIAESLLLAGPGLFFITLYAGRASRSRVGSLIPSLAWLAMVIAVSAGRPEGDNAYLLASYQGLLLAPLGMAGAALGLNRAHRRPWPIALTPASLHGSAYDALGQPGVQALPLEADS